MSEKDKFFKEKEKPGGQPEGKIVQMIIFNLGDEEFGTDIAQVREIVRRGAVTPIPDSPDFIKGVTNIRGEIAVVIDLKNRFSLPAKKDIEEKHIVMTEQDKNLFGLMVDEVSEVLRIPEKEIKITPELVTRIDKMYISGVLTLENRLIMVLDLEKVLSEEELAKLSEIRLKHRAVVEKTQEKAEKKAATAEIPKAPKVATAEAPQKTETPEAKVAAEPAIEKKVRKK